MCCPTHTTRDQAELFELSAPGPEPAREGALAAFRALFPDDERMRCRCARTGVPCLRKATGEDLDCDWCRETDHERWWAERAAAEALAVSPAGPFSVATLDLYYSPLRRPRKL